jgi:transcriptional regulator with XRE-family HTH domain
MKLAHYLDEKSLNATAFAAAVGVEPSTVTRLLRGERTPSLALAARIRAATEGKVTADDFLPAPASTEAA